MVPVFKDGKRTVVHPNRVKPYSLEAAQTIVDQVRRTLTASAYQSRDHLQGSIEQLREFIRAAGEVIDACREEMEILQAKRAALHSTAAAEKLQSAFAKVKINLERHARMRSRMQETISRAHNALILWRDPKRMQIEKPNSHPETADLRREIKALRRGER